MRYETFSQHNIRIAEKVLKTAKEQENEKLKSGKYQYVETFKGLVLKKIK